MGFRHKEEGGKSEIVSIGLMRGIASAMVCLYHLTNGNRRLLPDDNILRTSGWWLHTGVEIFFMISGFIIPYSMYVNNYSIKNIGTFFKKSIIRIEPPYLISISVVLGLGYISALMPFYRGVTFSIDWLNIAGHIVYLNTFTGAQWIQDLYWTLAIEFQYYIIIAVVYALLVSKKLYLRILFFLLFMSIVLLGQYAPFSIAGFAGFFMMGILLFQYYCRISTAFKFLFLALLTVIAIYFLHGFVLAALSVVTLLIIAFIKRVPPFFSFLGTISYSLYLVHSPFGGRIINITE